MNIKSLLIGSAAALVAVSGARAADAIVAAEPEPVEYVRVCDAFGTGYFYIPGTETCLQLSGYVRVQNSYTGNDITNGAAFTAATTFAATADSSMVAQSSRARFNVTAKSDSEYGVLTSYIGMQGNDGAMGVDEVFLSLGGFKTGMFYHWLDSGLAGETDSLYGANTRFNSIMYQANSGAFTYGVSMDMYPAAWATNSANALAIAGTEGLGVSGIIGGTFGAVTTSLVGFYDTEVNEGGVRFLAAAEVGPGTLGVQAAYATDANMYIGASGFGVTATAFAYQEWLVGADYTFQASEKLKLGVGAQYASINATAAAIATKPNVGDIWKVGATADYAITSGLAFKATVNYEMLDGNAIVGNVQRDSITGYVRLQRSF
jgi:hypothetical protein